MAINFKKSACISIKDRMDARCAKISSSTSNTIPLVKEKNTLVFTYCSRVHLNAH